MAVRAVRRKCSVGGNCGVDHASHGMSSTRIVFRSGSVLRIPGSGCRPFPQFGAPPYAPSRLPPDGAGVRAAGPALPVARRAVVRPAEPLQHRADRPPGPQLLLPGGPPRGGHRLPLHCSAGHVLAAARRGTHPCCSTRPDCRKIGIGLGCYSLHCFFLRPVCALCCVTSCCVVWCCVASARTHTPARIHACLLYPHVVSNGPVSFATSTPQSKTAFWSALYIFLN